MKFTLRIDAGNAAFEDAPGREIARILRTIAIRLDADIREGVAIDINGNTVGRYALKGGKR